MNNIYFVSKSGNIYSNYDIAKAFDILHGWTIDANDFNKVREEALKLPGIVGEFENPTVDYFLEKGEFIRAVKLVYDAENISLLAARDKVKQRREQLSKLNGHDD